MWQHNTVVHTSVHSKGRISKAGIKREVVSHLLADLHGLHTVRQPTTFVHICIPSKRDKQQRYLLALCTDHGD